MCTRVVYSGKNGMVVTGRSMDWKTEMHSNLWVFPKGMERNGETGANSLQWTSKYGSVVTSAFEIASTDGMNEKGLVANLLWLPETEYPVRDQSKPGLAITAWVQYMLDNFATVDEAVAFIDENTFQVVSDLMPDGFPPGNLAFIYFRRNGRLCDIRIYGWKADCLPQQGVQSNDQLPYLQQATGTKRILEINRRIELPARNQPSVRPFCKSQFLYQCPAPNR